MALFIKGKTPCALCGLPIMTDDAVLFPAFLGPGHRLHEFSDGVFHSRCFEAWGDRHEFARLYAKFRRIMDSRPRNVSMEEAERWAAEAFRGMDDPGEE